MGRCTLVPTYDVSCQAGPEGGCPYGSVHQPHKAEIGARVGLQLWKHLVAPTTTDVVTGPVATSARVVGTRTAHAPGGGRGGVTYSVQVDFAGGTAPFTLAGTRNCTTVAGYCCDGSANNGHTVDFDVSADGVTWFNTTAAAADAATGRVTFEVTLGARAASPGGGGGGGLAGGQRQRTPTLLRMTAASIWPQCTLYNSEGFPAHPFAMAIHS